MDKRAENWGGENENGLVGFKTAHYNMNTYLHQSFPKELLLNST